MFGFLICDSGFPTPSNDGLQEVKSNALKQDHEITVLNIVTDYPNIYS